jgi:hypothetical protein
MDSSSSVPVSCPACEQERGEGSSAAIATPAPFGKERQLFRPTEDSGQRDLEVAALCRLDVENRRPGADLRGEAGKLVSDQSVADWLLKSDEISEPKVLKGRADLVRQRRRGILRLLDGEDRGFPICQPIPRHAQPEGQSYWLLRLRDELEWLVLPVCAPTKTRPFARPVKDRLNHREARAILDWKASHLDMWLADRPHLVGGRLALDASRGVIFDTEAFVRWVYALMN